MANQTEQRFAAFVSYAKPDKEKAFEICESLEAKGLKCWIAPRDLRAGREFGEEIVRGIEQSRCLVLVLSGAANESPFVRREVERAVSKKKPVFPVRIEEVMPSPSLELFVSTTHWIDAWGGVLTDHVARLARDLDDSAVLADAAKEARKQRWRLRFPPWARIAAGFVLVLAAVLVANHLSDMFRAPEVDSGDHGVDSGTTGDTYDTTDFYDQVYDMAGMDPASVTQDDFSISLKPTGNGDDMSIDIVPPPQWRSALIAEYVNFGFDDGPLTNRAYGLTINEYQVDQDTLRNATTMTIAYDLNNGERIGPFTYDLSAAREAALSLATTQHANKAEALWTANGLPSPLSLNEENTRLELVVDRGRWDLELVYIGDGAHENLDRNSPFADVAYALGEGPFVDHVSSRDMPLDEMLSTTRVTAEIEVNGNVVAGPFTYDLDFADLARTSLLEDWRALSNADKERFVCTMEQPNRSLGLQAQYVAILGSLHSTTTASGETYVTEIGAPIAALASDFDRSDLINPRFDASPMVVRAVSATGSELGEYLCDAPYVYGFLPDGGRAITLAPAAGQDGEGLAIYVHFDPVYAKTPWSIYVDPAFASRYVRYSTDGQTFETVEISIPERPEISLGPDPGRRLDLELIFQDGRKAAYAGDVDFEQLRLSALKNLVFPENAELWCSSAKATLDQVRERYGESGEPDYGCTLQSSGQGGFGVPEAIALDIVEQVRFGCSPSDLDTVEDFATRRAEARQSSSDRFLFGGSGQACETVYAIFSTVDGADTDVMAAPVVSN